MSSTISSPSSSPLCSPKRSSSEDFIAREYQVEIVDQALKRNSIVFMPTGSGKTFIASMVIKLLSKEVEPKFSEGGKRTFFLVNTVPLVSQQANAVSQHVPLDVAQYSGDIGVDHWDKSIWLKELEEHQVLVMTAQIFLNLLLHNYLQLVKVNLIVFDECHHAVNNHVMKQIMELYSAAPEDNRPHVLGLTATLLNSSCKSNEVAECKKFLETTMCAKVIKPVNYEMVKRFSTNPDEIIIRYNKSETNKWQDTIDESVNYLHTILDVYLFTDKRLTPPTIDIPNAQLYEQKPPLQRKMKTLASDIIEANSTLGLYAASKAALVQIVRLERIKLTQTEHRLTNMITCVTSELHRLRKSLKDIMDEYENHAQPFIFGSNKIKELFKVIQAIKPTDYTLVFVEKRITAKLLFYIFQDLAKHNENFKHIRPDFIVGFNSNPLNDTRELLFERKTNMETLKRFRNNETNLLFASDVIEEGIDVPLCNFVIKFDLPKSYRSYVQSKGRARHSDSKYIMLISNEENKFIATYNHFKETEQALKNCIGYINIGFIDENEKTRLTIPPYQPYGPSGPKITVLSAISLLNRYCCMLPQDKFSSLTIFWWFREEHSKFIVSVKLPINSAIKEVLESPPCFSKTDAKRAVALDACIRLHKLKELDANLLPCGSNSDLLSDKDLFPCWLHEEAHSKYKAGSKKCRRIHNKKFPEWMCNCRPEPEVDLYLHFIDLKPNYIPESTSRHRAFFNLLNSPSQFAILSSKQWPQICDFSMYMNVGEVSVKLKTNSKTLKLTEMEINELYDFHCLLFTEALAIVKKFLVRDFDNEENNYFVVPVLNDQNDISIDWSTVRDQKQIPEAVAVPIEDRKNFKKDYQSYLNKIVVPWYRPQGTSTKYVVTRISDSETPESPFPSENYTTYAEYYHERYGLKICDMDQPLIEVRAISSKINCILPRGKRKHGSRKNRKDEEDFEETLIPELCTLLDFPAVYMLKVTILPSVLHRITHLLIAEELRRKIAKDTALGKVDLQPNFNWDPLELDKNALKEDEDVGMQSTIDVSNHITSNLKSLTKHNYPWEQEEEPQDVDRQIGDVDLVSIIYYQKFVDKPTNLKTSEPNTSVKRSFNAADLEGLVGLHTLNNNNNTYENLLSSLTPPLSILNENNNENVGPQQSELLQALTSITAGDIVNYERLETLGDSFLKFAVSLSLFTYYQDKDEGKLTQVKGKMVGNRNLFYSGNSVNLGQLLKVYDFSSADWEVPGFTLLRVFKNRLREEKISPALLHHIELSPEERDKGVLTDISLAHFQTFISDEIEKEDSTHSSLALIGQQSIPDKIIADSVEALIGVYLKSYGIVGAVKLCNWLGVIPEQISNIEKLFHTPAPSPLLADINIDVNNFLVLPDKLEATINYKFKDRSFLLQALSHSSYINHTTDCYQRLEFLGDAILDFLITAHIYDACGNLTPGELTDLRSALVNNVTFACLSVRYGFHVHMNSMACKLTEIINRFVEHQESRNHKIGAEVLFLIEERDIQVAECIDVPKVLGDLFESMAAAVYLDSGKCLKTVWRVFYNLMKREIAEFSHNVPKNHIRLLYEKFPSPAPKYGKSRVFAENNVMIPLEVIVRNEPKVFHGIGENKAQAKLAAAKMALRFYHGDKKND